MICYLDKTFCTNWENCSLKDGCKDKLTQDVKDFAAEKGLPIAACECKCGGKND